MLCTTCKQRPAIAGARVCQPCGAHKALECEAVNG